MIKITFVTLLIMGYFFMSGYFSINLYSYYELTTAASMIIPRRNEITMACLAFIIEASSSRIYDYIICGDDNDSTWFGNTYNMVLAGEEELINYQKSGKKLYKNFNKIISIMNSDLFCNQFEDIESNLILNCRMQNTQLWNS